MKLRMDDRTVEKNYFRKCVYQNVTQDNKRKGGGVSSQNDTLRNKNIDNRSRIKMEQQKFDLFGFCFLSSFQAEDENKSLF